MFEAAKRLGTTLVVTLTADQHVNKGPGRPVFSQDQRAYCIRKCKDVDVVEVCFHKTGLPMIEKYKPDVYVKGADYKVEDKHGSLDLEKQAVERGGGKLLIMDGLPIYSSTALIQKLRETL